jgi:hypothetical protein
MTTIRTHHYAALALTVCVALPAAQARTMPHGSSAAVPSRLEAAMDPTVDRLNGIDYMSGGIGAEERARFDAAKPRFNTHFLFTAESDGEFLADVKVAVRDREGRTVFDLRDAGPMLWMQLPAGTYTVEAAYDGRLEKTTVRVGGRLQAMHVFHWTTASRSARDGRATG